MISWEAEQIIVDALSQANGSRPNVKRIARMADVSRDTVHRFVNGKRKARCRPGMPVVLSETPKQVEVHRCQCGFLVYFEPCQICAALQGRA